jgi:hypothetical protein
MKFVSARPSVIPGILEQHVEEAAGLWAMRASGSDSPAWRTFELVRFDERLEAHLDGLRISGARGLERAVQQLAAEPGPSAMFVAAALMLSQGAIRPLSRLVTQLGDAPAGPSRDLGDHDDWDRTSRVCCRLGIRGWN